MSTDPKRPAGGSSRRTSAEPKAQELTEATERVAERIAGLSRAAISRLTEINAEMERELEELGRLTNRIAEDQAEKPINRNPSSQGATLLAIQLLASGTPREKIERRLREDFSIEDPSRIVDGVVGPPKREPVSAPRRRRGRGGGTPRRGK